MSDIGDRADGKHQNFEIGDGVSMNLDDKFSDVTPRHTNRGTGIEPFVISS